MRLCLDGKPKVSFWDEFQVCVWGGPRLVEALRAFPMLVPDKVILTSLYCVWGTKAKWSRGPGTPDPFRTKCRRSWLALDGQGLDPDYWAHARGWGRVGDVETLPAFSWRDPILVRESGGAEPVPAARACASRGEHTAGGAQASSPGESFQRWQDSATWRRLWSTECLCPGS